MSEDQAVGYKKPPHSTRFKPGESGNPKGRPKQKAKPTKGYPDNAAVFYEALNQELVITENGVRRKVTAQAVIIKQLVARATKGDFPAIKCLITMMAKFGLPPELNEKAYEEIELPENMTIEEAQKAYARIIKMSRRDYS